MSFSQNNQTYNELFTEPMQQADIAYHGGIVADEQIYRFSASPKKRKPIKNNSEVTNA